MAIPAPRTRWSWLATQPSVYDVLVAICASGIGIASAVNYWTQKRPELAIVVVATTTFVVIFSLLKHGFVLKEASKKESMHELEACLYTLHSILGPAPECTLRLAVHLPLPKEERFAQITEYIGDEPKPGRIGRPFPINAWIIGKA